MIEKYQKLDLENLKKESIDKFEESNENRILGDKFNLEKDKLEEEIEKIKRAKISEEDKNKLIDEINEAIKKIQKQYEYDVIKEEERIQRELTEQIKCMQDIADELEKQADDIRDIKIEAAYTASYEVQKAVDVAVDQKQAFDQLKEESYEKLSSQIKEFEIQRQKINIRRSR